MKKLNVFLTILSNGKFNQVQNQSSLVEAGMSEIRDRAKAAPAKSKNFRDSIFPASGKKFRSVSLKLPVSSA